MTLATADELEHMSRPAAFAVEALLWLWSLLTRWLQRCCDASGQLRDAGLRLIVISTSSANKAFSRNLDSPARHPRPLASVAGHSARIPMIYRSQTRITVVIARWIERCKAIRSARAFRFRGQAVYDTGRDRWTKRAGPIQGMTATSRRVGPYSTVRNSSFSVMVRRNWRANFSISNPQLE